MSISGLQRDLQLRWSKIWQLYNVEKENNVDPDDGNSWVCDACRLPIFSTPFTTVDRDRNLVLHDQCANLPEILEGHPWHPGADLILHQQTASDNNNNENIYFCFRCHNLICGSRFYKCHIPFIGDVQFDLACALTIRILHRSHRHKLTAMMGSSSSFICTACGTQHRPPRFITQGYSTPWELSYVCSLCDFWIHPDCAMLPNAIVIDKHHPHPLLLTYFDKKIDKIDFKCVICNQPGKVHGLGMYTCFHCPYLVHIKCAIYSDPHGFKRVLIRDAQIPGLLRLPMPNEDTSVMLRMTKTVVTNVDAASTSSSGGHHGDHTAIISRRDEHQIDGSKLLLFENDKVHEHPMVFHDHHQDGHLPVVDRVCDACVQLISPSDPFYSCSNNTGSELCTNFFLHDCCAHLPDAFTQHLAHYRHHPFSLFTKVDTKNPFDLFECKCCRRRCNGFVYACKECNFHLDVVCASMPNSITHDTHGKSSHIFHRSYGNRNTTICNCCKKTMINTDIFYKCNICRNFGLHAKCALFPDTVRHRFDRHPLKLITTTRADRQLVADREYMFCEICEKDLDDSCWHYGCKDCDQSFHIDCIPSLDSLSKIKFGYTVRVSCHDCPVAAVRALSVDGYRCGHCELIIRESDKIAFECSECYFRIHQECAKKLILQ